MRRNIHDVVSARVTVSANLLTSVLSSFPFFHSCYSQIESVGGGATKVIDCTYTLNGRYVYVSKYATGVLTLCEVEVYTDCKFIRLSMFVTGELKCRQRMCEDAYRASSNGIERSI